MYTYVCLVWYFRDYKCIYLFSALIAFACDYVFEFFDSDLHFSLMAHANSYLSICYCYY